MCGTEGNTVTEEGKGGLSEKTYATATAISLRVKRLCGWKIRE